MNKTIAGVLVAVVAIGALGLIYANNKPEDKKAENNHSQEMGSMRSSSSEESSQPASDEVLSGMVEMDIKDFAFAKSNIKVKKGTIVKWTNQDGAKHDITPDNPSNEFKASELLAKGESYSVTFNAVGSFSYFCSPHPFMKGTVEVAE